jgi:DNA-binding transcriptional LysR family regulator
MDVDLAKTFLEIMSSGTFIEASERLHVTQTTITARVSKLEEKLGCQLFVRNRSGAKLTVHGERFVEYAHTFVQTWERAQAELNLPAGIESRLCLGSETSLWNPVMLNWTLWIKENLPNIALHTEISDNQLLFSKLEKSSLDAIIVHKPNYHSSYVVEQVLEEKLIHVRSAHNNKVGIFIDWGDEFKEQYDAGLPIPRQNGFSTNFGPLALKLMLAKGGNGYFRKRVVQTYLDQGSLEQVPNSTEFTYPLFMIYKKGIQSPDFVSALKGLKQSLDNSVNWLI